MERVLRAGNIELELRGAERLGNDKFIKNLIQVQIRSLREERGGNEREKPPAHGVPASQSDVGASEG